MEKQRNSLEIMDIEKSQPSGQPPGQIVENSSAPPYSGAEQLSRTDFESLEIHIEELVLHGFAPRDRHRMGDALERELTRLFVRQDVPATLAKSRDLARLDLGSLEIPAGSDPEETAVRIARALYGGLIR